MSNVLLLQTWCTSVGMDGVKRQEWYSFKRWQVVFFGPIRHRGARGQHSCREANPPHSFSAPKAGVTLPALNTSSWTCSCRPDKTSPGLLQKDPILAGNTPSLYFLTTIKSSSPSVLTLQQDFILGISSPWLFLVWFTPGQLICTCCTSWQSKLR